MQVKQTAKVEETSCRGSCEHIKESIGRKKDTFLQADARLIIVAGSDTTAAAFTGTYSIILRSNQIR